MLPTCPRTPTRAVVVLDDSPEADYIDNEFDGDSDTGLSTMASDSATPSSSDDADPFRSSSDTSRPRTRRPGLSKPFPPGRNTGRSDSYSISPQFAAPSRPRGIPDASSTTIAPARLVLLPAAGSRGPERILPLPTDRAVATVGSAPDQDVRVQLPFVAPQQCRIRFLPATGAMTLENLSDTCVTIATSSLPASPAVTNSAPTPTTASHAVARGTALPVRHNDIITIGDPSSTTHSRQFRLEQVRPSSPLIGTSPLPLSTAPTRAPIESPVPPTTVLPPPPPATPARAAPVPSTPKSVRFGPALRPEIFDAEEPPSSPLVRGEPVAVPPPPAGPSTPRLLSTPGKSGGAETPRSILKKRVQRIRLVSPAKFRSPAGNAMWRAAAAAAVASVVPPGSAVAATATTTRAAVLGTVGKPMPAVRTASPAPVDQFWKRPRPPPNLNVEDFTPRTAAAKTATVSTAELDEVEDDAVDESDAVVLPELGAEEDEAAASSVTPDADGDESGATAASPDSDADADIEMGGSSDGVEDEAGASADEPPQDDSVAVDSDGDPTADSETNTTEDDAMETGKAAPTHDTDSPAPSTTDHPSPALNLMDIDVPAPMAPSAPVRAFRILDTALQRSSSPLAPSRERRMLARGPPLTLALRPPAFPKLHTQASAPVASTRPADPLPASNLAPESDATAASTLAPPASASSPSRLPSPLLSGSSPCAPPATPGPVAERAPASFLARVVASTPPAAAPVEQSSPPTPPREPATATKPASSPVHETAVNDSPVAEPAREPTEPTPTLSPLPLAHAPRAVVTVRVEVPLVTPTASDWLPRRSPRKRALPAAATASAGTAADAPATPPAKRGPGRPRKTPAASPAIAPSTPTRRGPGRPRKVVATPDRATDVDAATDGDVTPTANTTLPVLGPASAALLAVSPAATSAPAPAAPAPSPDKRRPGRPRKHPLPEAAAGPSGSTAAAHADAPPSTPVKRGPGRPRKHPLPASSPLAPAPKPAAPIKRGPGRPRKSAALDMDVASSPIRRGPGRSRKNPTLNADIASSPIRRGPGRPRKTAVASPKPAALPAPNLDVPGSSPIKRGPGRPRKQVTAPIIESVSWGAAAAATAPEPDPDVTASGDDKEVLPHTPKPEQQDVRRPTPASKRARSPPPPPPAVGVRRSARVPVRRKLFDQDARIDLDEVVGSDASSSVEEGDVSEDDGGATWGPASKRARVG